MRLAASVLLLLLAACGPVTMQQAERQCYERARLAQQPRGEVGVGANSNGGGGARLRLEVSSDFLLGRDPSAVFDSCVFQKTGLPPTQPFYSRTDLKG